MFELLKECQMFLLSHQDFCFQLLLVLLFTPTCVVFVHEFPAQKVIKVHDLEN